jgi:hypothetical protein
MTARPEDLSLEVEGFGRVKLPVTPAKARKLERLFIDASSAAAAAGQAMFERLRELRRAVAAGAELSAPAFHDAYHPYIEAVWAYRVAVRQELEGKSLSPAVFGWTAWDGKERCPLCRAGLAATS